jgi:hypothetical protein
VFDTAVRVQTFCYRAESDPYKEGKDKVNPAPGGGGGEWAAPAPSEGNKK